MATESSFNRIDVRNDPDCNWWHYDDDVGKSIVAVADRVRDNMAGEIDRFETCYSMCIDTPSSGLTPGSRPNNWEMFDNEPLALNVTESICGALQAEITQAQPRPMFLTVGGDYDLRRKAKRANQYLDGYFQSGGMYEEIGPDVAYSAVRFGTGLAITMLRHGEVVTESVAPWELLVDEVDGVKCKPRSLYRIRYMSRDEALEEWPDAEAEIEAASAPTGEWALQDYGSVVDVILVVYAWHLPTRAPKGDKPGSGDGRFVVALHSDGTTLEDREWTRPRFPVSVYRWEKKPFGFWGRGVCDMLFGPQYAINKESMTIDAAHDMAGTSLIVGRNANIVKAHIQNGLGGIIEADDVNGIKPFQPPAVNPDKYMYLDRLIAHCFDRVGVSKLQVHGELPDGLRNASGRALRTYIDTSSKRFIDALRGYENFFLDVARCVVDELREAAELYPNEGFDVVSKTKTHIERLSWKDIAVADPYVLDLWPTNLLPNTPAGKLAEVDERLPLFQALGLGPESILRLLAMPDLDAETKLLTAPRDNIDRVLEKILDDEEYIAPQPEWPIQMCLKMGVLKEQEGQCDEIGETRLSLLRRWIVDCTNLLAPPPAATVTPEQQQIAANNMNAGAVPAQPAPPPQQGVAA